MPLHAATSDEDFTAISTPVTFGPGTSDDIVMCVSVPVFADGLVECEEKFNILFDLITTGTSISRGNSVTAVTLIDNEGQYTYILV